jgi:hypothetical protein
MTIIKPGTSEPSVANMVELVRTNSKRFVDITFMDSDGTAIDIDEDQVGGNPTGALDLDITDLAGNSVFAESYWPTSNAIGRRIIKSATGKYYINFGTEDGETDTVGTYLANWHLRENIDTENVYATQVLEIVSPRTLSILPKLRFMVDKTVKANLPEENCFLGYTDSQMIIGLQLGLCMLNEYQPYPCWRTLDDYNIAIHGHVLIKAAMYQLLTAQGLFAIDTDIPQFSDQGHSFVLVHFTGLEQVANRLKAELDRIVPDVKRHYVNSGSLGVEIRMSNATYMMFSSMPYGSIYRGYWART